MKQAAGLARRSPARAFAAALAVLVLLVLGVAFWWTAEPAGVAAPASAGTSPLPEKLPVGVSLPQTPAAVAQGTAAPASPTSAMATGAGTRSANGVFETDAAGRLLVDARMRLAVEALIGLNPAEAMPALMATEVQGLPAQAAAQARELAQSLEAYQAAQRAAFPPGEAPLVPQEGLAELATLVALRTSYFGEEAARRMFGADEAVSRRLLQLMAEDTDSTLSMQDKAQRAQLRYNRERATTPGVR